MDYNPFTPKLKETQEQIEQKEQHSARLQNQLTWAEQFDPIAAATQIEQLRLDKKDCGSKAVDLKSKFRDLSEQKEQLQNQVPDLISRAKIGMNPLSWFSRQRPIHRRNLDKIRREIESISITQNIVKSRYDQSLIHASSIETELSTINAELSQFQEFNEETTRNEIQRLDLDLRTLKSEHEDLTKRARGVDQKIAEDLTRLNRCDSEIEAVASRKEELKNDRAELESEIDWAKYFEERLGQGSSRKERWEVHKDCENHFDNGSPREVLKDLRDKKKEVERSINESNTEFNRLRRRRNKIEERVRHLANLASREIRTLVIDGNNCCWLNNLGSKRFIRLAALTPLTKNWSISTPFW
ncbi:MAG TPA: hypothetical protein PKE40_01675 [Arachnia sp.]|nr:hypothetical protein [Arachnia sp.]HMT85038.1 hypothetical protein [Arachnia sp.]